VISRCSIALQRGESNGEIPREGKNLFSYPITKSSKMKVIAGMNKHQQQILDQFTRQAEPFARAQAIRSPEALDRIVQMADAGAEDTVLDVACGPGLLACAFARVVRHAVGVDITPAMLDQARKTEAEHGVNNVSWQLGDILSLPYPNGHFSIVVSRFVFHHLLDPLVALREIKRVCKPGGRVVVADMAPAAGKADALNAMERLRDPSHVRAMPLDELKSLFAEAGLPTPRTDHYRLPGELEDLLRRSFPKAGDDGRIRGIFADSLADDALDLATCRKDGKIFYSFPVAILVSVVSN
jgi:ubiquinone/menaquinone biosynthesis C-methylase UbiE